MSNGTNVYWGEVATDTSSLLSKVNNNNTLQTVEGPVSFTNLLTLNRIKGTNATTGTYGTTLPTGTIDTGRIFFQISTPYYELPEGGTPGQVLKKVGQTNQRTYEWGDASSAISATSDTQHDLYICGVRITNPDGQLHYYPDVTITNGKVQGAAWNDYAEYRAVKEEIKAGHCIIENGDGTLSLSTKRLQPGAEIISDTYGMVIGKTKEQQVPVAITGRVLAYMYEPLNELQIGAPVCSGPNGTISQMTEEEARNYPWVIIGTISSIPKAKTWNKVDIDGRVWIRVR